MDNPIVYTVTPVGTGSCRLYTHDGRVKVGDNDITVANSNLLKMMIITSEILNDEGFAVLFEVD